jgi:hypothetical protein
MGSDQPTKPRRGRKTYIPALLFLLGLGALLRSNLAAPPPPPPPPHPPPYLSEECIEREREPHICLIGIFAGAVFVRALGRQRHGKRRRLWPPPTTFEVLSLRADEASAPPRRDFGSGRVSNAKAIAAVNSGAPWRRHGSPPRKLVFPPDEPSVAVGAPRGVRAKMLGDSIEVSWVAASTRGGAEVASYTLQLQALLSGLGGLDHPHWQDSGGPTAFLTGSSHVVPKPPGGGRYRVRMRAVSTGDAAGEWQESEWSAPSPEFSV